MRFESLRDRWQMARLCAAYGRLRYASRECWETHQHVLDFDDASSPDRVPVASLPCGWPVRRLMRWAMGSWRRQDVLNRWCLGSLPPSIQFDLWPVLRSGAYVVAVSEGGGGTLDAHLAAGAAMQRFWLTAASLGLAVQPSFSPLIFSSYVRTGTRCFADLRLWRRAERLAARWDAFLGAGHARRAMFAMRIGYAAAPPARSGRLCSGVLTTPWNDGLAATGRPA